MSRIWTPTLCLLALAGGCAPKGPMEPPKKPPTPPELAELGRLVGTWAGTAEMISPSPEEMKKMMPEGAETPPSSFEGRSKGEWILGGMYLREEGWHSMTGDQRMEYVSHTTWDAKAKRYRMWFFDDWGGHGWGWMTYDPASKMFHGKTTGIDARGQKSSGEGTWSFADDDTVEWSWTERGPMGKMTLKGTSKRQP